MKIKFRCLYPEFQNTHINIDYPIAHIRLFYWNTKAFLAQEYISLAVFGKLLGILVLSALQLRTLFVLFNFFWIRATLMSLL